MSFYNCQCRSCGKWGSKEISGLKQMTKGRFRCSYCLKTFKLKKINILGFALNVRGPYASGLRAASMCAQWNAETIMGEIE